MKPHNKLPPTERLQEFFEIDPSIPNGLRWKKKASKNTIIGSPAGRKSIYGRWEVRLDKVLYVSARIIYKLYTGEDPMGFEIDHLDRDPCNNAPSNLVLATRGDQQCNIQVRGKVPYRNVCLDKNGHKIGCPYVSHVGLMIDGKKTSRFLGYYSNPYEASLVALLWKKDRGMRWEYAPAGTQ
jgi:hypothetical protein